MAGRCVRGDFGYSIQSHRPVTDEIAKRIPPTLVLMGDGDRHRGLVGIPFGIISALRQYSKLDYALTSVDDAHDQHADLRAGLAGRSTSSRSGCTCSPPSGIQTLGKPFTIPDFLAHLILPALVLGLSSAAAAAALHAGEHARRPEQRIRRHRQGEGRWHPHASPIRHAFRNSLIPIITVIGLLLPELVAGAVITEQIFAWPGMGQLAVRAASATATPA